MAEREANEKGPEPKPSPQEKAAPAPGPEAAQGQSRELTGGGGGPLDAASGQAAELGGGGGAPLPDGMQAQFGEQLGADLSGVRVHASAEDGLMAAEMGAEAVAVGQDIHGSAQALDPDSAEGAERLAHEVVHTVQHQQGGAQAHGYTTTAEGDAVEREAVTGAAALVSGQSFQVRESGGGAIARDKAAVTAKLDATPFSASETLALITSQSNAHKRDILGDSAVTTKMVNQFSGAQMATALRALTSKPSTWSWADLLKNRLNLLRRAGADAAAAQYWLANTTAPSRAGIASDANLRTWLAGEGGALSVFPEEASGLSAEALASAAMMSWIVSSSTAPMLLRAAANSATPGTAVTAIDANGGWAWLSGLQDGAALSPAQFAAVETLWIAAPVGSAGEAALQAKLAIAPLATSPADALTQVNAMLGGGTGTEPQILNLLGQLDVAGMAAVDMGKVRGRLTGANLAQGLLLLGQSPTEIAQALMLSLVTDSAPILSVLSAAPLAERAEAAGDLFAGTYINAVSGSVHPRSVYAVKPGEEAQFFDKEFFVDAAIDRLSAQDALAYLTTRSGISAFGTWCDANPMRAMALIAALPPKDQINRSQQGDPRALVVVTSNPLIAAAVQTYFSDDVSTGATSTSAAIPEEATRTPVEQLDHLLDNAGSGSELVQACGALVHPENNDLANDSTRLAKLRLLTTNDQFHQAGVAMRLIPKWHIKYLLAGGDVDSERIQSIIAACDEQQKLEIIGWEAVMFTAGAAMHAAPPLNLFGWVNELPLDALRYDAFCNWMFARHASSDLMRLFGGDATKATRYAPALDTNLRWGWLDDLEGGNALLPDEYDALMNLSMATNQPETAARIDELTGDSTDTMSAEDAFDELLLQLLSPWTADGPLCLRLVNQLDDTQKTALTEDEQMAQAVFAFDGPEMSRYVMSLGLPLADQLAWLGLATAGSPDAEQVLSLVNRADGAQQALALADDSARAVVQGVSPLGPLQAFPAMADAVAQAVPIEGFWTWLIDSTTPLELLRVVATSGAVLQSVATLKAAGKLDEFDDLPRGQGLRDTARTQCDTVMEDCDDADCEKKIFSARFDIALTGDWAGIEREDLVYLYNRLKALPLQHVSNNPRLVRFNRHHSGGGTYEGSNNQINIGADLTYQWEQYADTATETDPADQWNEMVKKFDTTTRHEVGHAVDATLGEQTSIVYDWAGWQKYAENDMGSWITAMDGWNASGGAEPSATDKTAIKEVIAQYMNAGRLEIRGPGFSIGSMIAPDHVWHSFGHVRIVDLMNNNDGLIYTKSYRGSSNIFSVNYYYNRYMKCSTIAGANVPRDYSIFAPEEWFADMYGEFYREYDGTPATEDKLGGHCPARVKTWFMANVHRLGRSPHDLEGQSTPEGTHAAQPSGG